MKLKNGIKIAILGARGLIGKKFLNILEENNIEAKIDCFGTTDNTQINYREETLNIKNIEDFEPSNYDLILSAVDADVALELKSKIKESNVLWIDKSSAMRMHDDVPLIVPEVNMDDIKGSKIIASPNCIAIPLAIFLHAIRNLNIHNVICSTYQSVSGAGKKAMDAFFRELKDTLMRSVKTGQLFEHPMACNVIPAIGAIDENGFCDEEIKIKEELKKILKVDYPINVTAMRVPVLVGHLISLTFEVTKHVSMDHIKKLLEVGGISYTEGLVTPVIASSEDDIFASRLRYNGEHDKVHSYSVVIVCDNLRKGGALNALEIADKLFN